MLKAPALAILGCFLKIRKIILGRPKLKGGKLFKGLKNTLRAEFQWVVEECGTGGGLSCMGGRQPGAGLALGSLGLHPGYSVSQESLFLEHFP